MCKALYDIKEEGALEKLYDLVKKGLLALGVAAKEANMTEETFKANMDKYFASLK